MNFRKISLTVLSFLAGFLLINTAKAIVIDSYSMAKANVAVIQNDNPDILKIKVWGKSKLLQKAQKTVLQIFNKQKEILVEQENPAKFSQKNPELMESDFEIDLLKNKLAGDLNIKAEIYNNDGQKVGFGEIQKNFAGNVEEKSTISDLKIKVDKDLVKGSVNFTNKAEKGKFVVKVDVYKDNNTHDYVGTFSSEPVEFLTGETKEISFSFAKPSDPQLYNVKVGIVQKDQEVTGKLTGNFLVKGDFGEFYSLDVSPAKYLKVGETVIVKFTGATTTGKDDPLSVEINVKNENGMSLQKFVSVSPESDLKEFSGQEMFLIDKDSGQLSVEAILWKDNNELGRISKTTPKFTKPKEMNFINKIRDLKSREKLSTADKYKIIAILVLIVLAIVIFIRGLIRSNKGKQFFLFFCLILASGTVFAEAVNYFPQDGTAYNLDSNSVFNQMGFWGELNSPQGGLLPDAGKTIKYEIILNGKEIKGEFTSLGNVEYKFTKRVPEDFKEDKYTVQIRFYGQDVNDRLDDLGLGTSGNDDIVINLKNANGDELMIFIDGTAPDPNFDFKKSDGNSLNSGDFVNSTFQLTLNCGDNLSGCYKNFAGFDVTGNFCDPGSVTNGNICKDSSHNVRPYQFKICDKAGNCQIKPAKIDFYDPVKPTMGDFGFDATNNGFWNNFGSNIASGYITDFKVKDIMDPAEGSLTSVDNYVCEHSSDFVLDTNVCIEKQLAVCDAVTSPFFNVDYCEWDSNSSTYVPHGSCPDGMTYNVTSGECEKSCYTDRFPYCFNVQPST